MENMFRFNEIFLQYFHTVFRYDKMDSMVFHQNVKSSEYVVKFKLIKLVHGNPVFQFIERAQCYVFHYFDTLFLLTEIKKKY